MPDPELPGDDDAAAQPPEDPSFPKMCQWTNQHNALAHFASYTGATQSQQHIKPLHWYVACRLVIEGGFRPEEITPRPPFSFSKRRGKWHLTYDPALANVNGGAKPGQCGGVKAGQRQGFAADMERAPIGALSMSAVAFSIRV
ncbi:hypothetical protein KQ302_03375 [Synechococcus sp. CS-602]|uniref:hypothetical protein n=1 Tax=Synechococcus sp. CS-602 TaxID=2847982 RepID=UPI00223B9C0D|nr:hypothetical protein [Synechococcus sp. CS-602]MCT0204159.1 hypothetical protein [Synechococcus sp. CS-602]